METLTVRQKQVLDYIRESIEKQGYPPTFREIAEQMGIKSTNGVNDHLKALEKKGYLHRDDLKSRALRPLKPSFSSTINNIASHEVMDMCILVPVLGKCAAGTPILAVEHAEETLKVDKFFLGPHREIFALRVYGDSMIEAGIFHGDYIFVKKQVTAQSGEIVVAMINDEATIKYFCPEGDRIVFKPANRLMQPITVHRDDFKLVNLLGTVIGVYRRLT